MNEWKEIALWLAECEAATLEHLQSLENPPRNELNRHLSVCRDARRMIRNTHFEGLPSSYFRVVERLNKALIKAKP